MNEARRRLRYPEIGFLAVVFKPRLAAQFQRQYEAFRGRQGFSMPGRLFVGVWLLFAFCFLKPRIGGQDSWRAPLWLCPQIDFSRPQLADPLRIALQIVFLTLVRQQSSFRTGRRARQFYRFANLRSRRFLFRFVALARWCVRQLQHRTERRQAQLEAAEDAPKSGLPAIVLLLLALVLAGLCITVPFSLEAQAAFVVVLMVTAMILRQVPGRFPAMLLMVASVIVSCRYIWWRTSSTINWDDALGLTLGLLLLFAELYAWVVLLLGYFQNSWPLQRSPVALPDDRRDWPSIDIMIPSYNEDLEVVRATVYACMGLDWPRDKLHIHILDDGKRESFRDFAKAVSVNYIRRPVNNHAKAGNINYALEHTSAEYVAIFDCDHIPTRAFMQVCMGWFLKDPKLALVQTPHHFYSPDPFERNLGNFRKVPNEGNLFYGLIQDGNDLWNSTFFCGSCAVMRRTALEEVGGIAVETVTEDAHTSLRMHRLGYHSAYLRAPISAGLATETLSAHIGQRIRWARGMAQILRVDNPLLGSGLRWQQRLCYFNAMMHFLAGIPRLIFLTAPLAFLLLHTYIIYAPASLLLLYVLPHMFHASVVNSLFQGKYRYSFWGEVYEAILSWYVARPTTVALFAPHKGTFNVTAKGGKVENFYYDWVMSKPYVFLVLLNIAGLIWGTYRMFAGPTAEISAVAINMLWTGYNLLILGAAVAVAGEVKQVRSAPRVEVDIPMSVRLPSGHMYAVSMQDFSLGGIRAEVAHGDLFRGLEDIEIVLDRAHQRFVFPAKIVYSNENTLGLRLGDLSTQQLVDYVQCTFARADTWVKWKQSYEDDQPGVSFAQVLRSGITGLRRLLENGPAPLPQITRGVVVVFDVLGSFRPRPVQLAG